MFVQRETTIADKSSDKGRLTKVVNDGSSSWYYYYVIRRQEHPFVDQVIWWEHLTNLPLFNDV